MEIKFTVENDALLIIYTTFLQEYISIPDMLSKITLLFVLISGIQIEGNNNQFGLGFNIIV